MRKCMQRFKTKVFTITLDEDKILYIFKLGKKKENEKKWQNVFKKSIEISGSSIYCL